MTVALLSIIQLGTSHFGSVEIGQSIAFTTFAFMLIVAAFECRGERESVLSMRTFDSRLMNRAALGVFVLAVMTTQMDGFRRILGTVPLNSHQFAWALVAPLALLILWELGKLIARRRAPAAAPVPSQA